MASGNLSNKANGARLSRLLIDKGTQALRATFDFYCQPAKLTTELHANKHKLQGLRYKVITPPQWTLLYPSAGSPDSKNFDITLLTILLRNICGLPSPATGWRTMPPDADNSVAANILRIQLYRNEVYAHKASTEIDDITFEKLWPKIFAALIGLGIPSREIDELKDAPLSPEEDSYSQQLINWKQSEDELITFVQENQGGIKKIQEEVANLKALIQKQQQEVSESCKDEGILRSLAKCNFKGHIEILTKKFLTGTREWLFQQLHSWFSDQESDSRLMILTAGPGIGKSVFAAKVCQVYKESGRLAACHFCKFNNSDYKNPHILLQSLAIHMCENVEGFREKLVEQLQRPHSKETLPDAFRVLLNDPLHALDEREPLMIVIDALDESEVNGKSELLELMSEEFLKLPKWIKMLITSRPELPVRKSLNHLKPIEIRSDDTLNSADLLLYLKFYLSDKCYSNNVLSLLVRKCEGSFLFAYYVQLELRNETELFTVKNLLNFAPRGISGFYEKQFKRLKVTLDKLAPSKLEFKCFLDVLVAAKGPLPLGLLQECLGLSDNANYKLRQAINDTLSSFLPVYDDCLTVYHRSLIDWLTSTDYSEHEFTSDVYNGVRCIWWACERVFIYLISLQTFSDLKLTTMMKYALRYGTSHLVDISDESKYHWLVNIKIIHVKRNIFPKCLLSSYLELERASRRSHSSISTYLRYNIWQHCRLFWLNIELPEIPGFYLQYVANGHTAIDAEEGDKRTAKSLLEKGRHVWCEDLDVIRYSAMPLGMMWFNTFVGCVGISPNMQLVAFGHGDGKISIIKFPNLEVLCRYDSEFTSSVPCCTFSPDNCTLLYGRLDSCISVKCCEKVSFFSGHSDQFLSCSFSPSGKKLVTTDNSRFVKLWDVNKQVLLTCLDVEGLVDSCFFTKCGLFIAGKENCEAGTCSLAIWNAFTLHRVDDRLPHKYPETVSDCLGVSVSIEWFLNSTMKDKNSEITSIIDLSGCPLFFRLPQGQPLCRLHGIKIYSVMQYKNRDCVLIYIDITKSFMVIDPVKRSIVAERRINWLPQIHGSLVVSKESFIILTTPFVLSFKTPDQLPFLPSSSFVKITCCSFSPDAFYFATCEAFGIIKIWTVDECKVTQICNMNEPGIAFWWSETCLWVYFSTYLAKIPVIAKQQVNISDVKKIPLRFCENATLEYLSFSEGFLILKCQDSAAIVGSKIVDGELQPPKKLLTDHLFDCAAVGPSARNILIASSTKYQLWKKIKSDDEVWPYSLHRNVNFVENASVSRDIRFSSKCYITDNGKFGIIVVLTGQMWGSCLGYLLVNLSSGEIANRITCHPNHEMCSMSVESLHAGNSYLIFQQRDERKVWISRLQDGKVAAVWSWYDISLPNWLILGFSAKHNLMAVPQIDGYINFVKIHYPERTN